MSGPLILAIETSCDETGIALVEGGRRIVAETVASQVAMHAASGGIVPEVAARAHLRWIVPTLDQTLAAGGADLSDVDAIAVTEGPGLAGSLIVGINFAKTLAWVHEKPLIAVNHLEGHVYAAWLGDSFDFSFSGLKTAARRIVETARADAGLAAHPDVPLPSETVAALSWGFQDSVVDVLATKTLRAASTTKARSIVLGGGVASNRVLRERLAQGAASLAIPLVVPRPGLCTDNGAMIGAAADRRLATGERAGMSLDARPSYPLAS